jgi:hypothetical protein
MKKETLRTLVFKTKKEAEKNRIEISIYFDSNYINSSIKKGIDERGNKGYYVEYSLHTI